MKKQISVFGDIADGMSTIDCLQDNVLLSCRDLFDNPIDERYYPVVKVGGVANILTARDWLVEPFVSMLCKVVANIKLFNFQWHNESNKKILYCSTEEPTNKSFAPFVQEEIEFSTFIFEDKELLPQLYSAIEKSKAAIVAVDLSTVEYINVQEIEQGIENMATIFNTSILVFWPYDKEWVPEGYDSVHHYFSKHNHNLCLLTKFDCKGTLICMFEFGGNRPQRVFYETLDEDTRLGTNNDFNTFLKVWRFSRCTQKWQEEKRTVIGKKIKMVTENGWVGAHVLKHELFGFLGFRYSWSTIKDMLSFAKKKGILSLSRIGKGRCKEHYKYNSECEKYLEP